MTPRVCAACGAPVVREGDRWADARSGDVGGTYDYCPATGEGHTVGGTR